MFSNLAGPIQHFRVAILEAWRSEVSADLCATKGFRGSPWLDVHGALQLLNSDHVRERERQGTAKRCTCWWGLLEHVPCRFCGGADNDGHLFWECTFPPLVETREHP